MVAIYLVSDVPNLSALPEGMSDKTGHFLAYGLLGGLLLRAVTLATWSRIDARSGLVAWAISAIYGASDEWHQVFVPGRMAGVDDWVADVLGAAAVVTLAVLAAVGLKAEDRKV